MRALVIHGAGDLRLEERPDPSPPGPGEVLVRLAVGGICGTDLHYLRHGGFGAVRLREPMILGHEVAGIAAALGEGVTGLREGDLVAVSPSQPCGACRFCREGLPNQCLAIRFYGSAMPFPHVQGAFREWLVADAAQCIPAEGLTPALAAMAEPLAVALHAAGRAGPLLGRRALVTGCGPIGLLAILALRAGGAAEVVATDLAPRPLAMARAAGADAALDTGTPEGAEALMARGADKGSFDILIECSGAAPALAAGIAAVRPRGVVVQLGMGGDMALPMQAITVKELDLRGSFRFHGEFALAVAMIRSGRIDPAPLVTHTLPLDRAAEAFALAQDRTRAMKVQIDFGDARP